MNFLKQNGESAASWGYRRALNLWPCYWGTGGRLVYLAGDWREARVRVALGLRTRNAVGTIFGGSIYGAIDPIYMLMLMHILGPDYIVWDKAATIHFKRPGRNWLEAQLLLTEEEIAEIRRLAALSKSVDRVYTVVFKDHDGLECATVEKTLYIRRK